MEIWNSQRYRGKSSEIIQKTKIPKINILILKETKTTCTEMTHTYSQGNSQRP